MKPISKILLASGALCMGLLIFWSIQHPSLSQTAPEDTAATHESMAQDQRPLVYKNPSDALKYQMHLDESGTYDLAKIIGGQQKHNNSISVSLSAMLTKTPLTSQGERAYLYQWSDVNVTMTVDENPAEAMVQSLKNLLEIGALVFEDSLGTSQKIILSNNIDAVGRDFIYSMIKKLQVVLPAQNSKNGWTTKEEDQHGTYLADYECLDCQLDADQVNLIKEIQQYANLKISMSGIARDLTIIAEPKGQTKIVFDRNDGVLTKIDSDTTNSLINLKSHQVFSQSTSRFQLNLVSSHATPSSQDVILNKHVENNFSGSKSYAELKSAQDEEGIRAIYQKDLEGATLIDLLQSCEALESLAADQKSKARSMLYLKVKALVYLDPSQMERVYDELLNAEVESERFNMFVKAASAIGHAPAQKMLRDLIKSRLQEAPAMRQLIPSLGMVESPELASEDLLLEIAREAADNESGRTAELALGIMGYNLNTLGSKERLDRIITRNQELLKEANDSNEQRLYLSQLGNVGSSKSLDTIKPYLNDVDLQTQMEAVMALRLMTDQAAFDTLEHTARNHSQLEVRLKAIEALNYQVPSKERLLLSSEIYRQSQDTSIRSTLLSSVFRLAQSLPEFARLELENLVANETNKDLQEIGNDMLNQLKTIEPLK